MFEAFYQAVESGKPSESYPGFERGSRIAKICQSVLKSARMDGAWVEIEKSGQETEEKERL